MDGKMMKAVMVAAIPFLTACAIQPLPSADTEAQLRDLEEKRREAIRVKDFETLGRIYAPSFVAIAGNGEVIDRDRLFRLFGTTDSSLTFTTDEIGVAQDGDTAVFIGRLVARAPDGRAVFQSRFTHTFVRREGTWICIAGQSTPIAGPR